MAFISFDLAYKGLKEFAWQEQAKLANLLKDRLQKEFNNLGFLNFFHLKKLEEDLSFFASYLEPFQNMLVLGIGGSALGAKALQKAFYSKQDLPGFTGKRLYILDNIHPDLVLGHVKNLDPQKTIVVVVSKSGSTIETLAQYFYIKNWLKNSVKDYKKHLIVITDPKKGFLRQEVREKGLLNLEVPPQMGGRYSVLSAVGLLPALFLEIKIKELLEGAKSLVELEKLENHPAFKLALWAFSLLTQGKSELIYFNYIPCWDFFGHWFAQLWAESLGKEEKGSMPLVGIGVTDQHSLLQMFLDGPKNKGCIFLKVKNLDCAEKFSFALPEQFAFLKEKSFADIFQAEALGTEMALATRMPLVEVEIEERSEKEAGKLIVLFQLTTLLTGWLLQINPLDQPAVELGKKLAKARLGAVGFTEEKKDLTAFLSRLSKKEVF